MTTHNSEPLAVLGDSAGTHFVVTEWGYEDDRVYVWGHLHEDGKRVCDMLLEEGVAEALEAAADIAARDRYVEEQGRMDDDNGD